MTTTPITRLALAAIAALALGACDRESTQQARQDAANAGQKVERALERTGQKIAEASRQAATEVKQAGAELKSTTISTSNDVRSTDTGRVLADTAITASIKTDYLKDPDLSVLKIDVDTKDGVVTLNGLAGTEEGRKRAGQLAGAIKGVKEVRNHLTVKKG
ncbi:MAG: BON domain-containing protein [Pseudomonadota bacterium]|nr:BON domain-containing protein [Pseudomonadota bacterium]